MSVAFWGLEGKTVVMTGGSGGVGGASAKLFAAQAGAKVALISRSGADEVADEIVTKGGVAKSYCADVVEREQMQGAFEQIVSDLGPVQSLLNISGTCDFYAADETPVEKVEVKDERWERIIGVNGKGVALAVQYAVQSMPRGGSIVNIGSTAGRYGAEMAVVDYSFSKAGLVGMTMGYAKILGPQGIRVNCIAPGPIEGTEMLSAADENQLDAIRAQTRVGRLCRAEDIAKASLFLASSMSEVITGETVDVNAGQYIST